MIYHLKGTFDDEQDRQIVKYKIEHDTTWKVVIPENKKLKCCDLIAMKNGKEIELEIERYMTNGDIERIFKDLTIIYRKFEGNGLFIKLSYDRTQCISAYFESFREYGYKSDRINGQANKKMLALPLDLHYVRHGWHGLYDLLDLF